MKRFLAAVVSVVILSGGALTAQDTKMIDKGRSLFKSKDCFKCHMIAGKGNKIGKLDGVASKLSAADMRKWMTSPVEMEAKLDHKPKVKMSSKIKELNLTSADIDALVAYLMTLK